MYSYMRKGGGVALLLQSIFSFNYLLFLIIIHQLHFLDLEAVHTAAAHVP